MQSPKKFPRRASWRYTDLELRSDVKRRIELAVRTLASTGLSTQIEVRSAMAKSVNINPDSGALKQLLASYMPNLGLVVVENQLPLLRRSRLNLIRLTEMGKGFARELGQETIESDWEKLIRLHSAELQPRHTIAVLYFAYQARLRGWQATILPKLTSTRFKPDVLVAKDGAKAYVEVELNNDKLEKWRAQRQYQEFAALCALTADSRNTLVCECKRLGVAGKATDIDTLITGSRQTPIGPLWAETWTR